MIRPDGAYELTRRRGSTGTVTRVTASSPNPLSGVKNQTTADTVVRWMVSMPTEYNRLFRADAANQRIGATQFIMWTGDLDFTSLSQDDYITKDGKRYEIITSVVEDTAFVITANEVKYQPVYVNRGLPDSIGLRQALTYRIASGFVTTWKTDNAGTSASNQIALPLDSGGVYDFNVDWGDGSEDHITAWDQAETTHTYSSAGTYTVSITGTIQRFAFANGGDKLKLLTVNSWGSLDLDEGIGAFYGCTNLTSTAIDKPTVGTTLRNYFRDCPNFNGDINNWDVSNVTNFNNVFTGCTVFNQPLDNWDTSAALTMVGTFQNCVAFNQDIGGWDVSKVTTMQDMLRNCTVFDQDLSLWNVSSVTNFTNAFRDCPAFNSDISGWNTSSATLMTTMFANSTSFDQDLGGWDVADVTDMTTMFSGVTLSTANYDAILIGWAAQTLQSGVTAHFGGSKYTNSGAALAARNDLLDAPELWSITDGGPA